MPRTWIVGYDFSECADAAAALAAQDLQKNEGRVVLLHAWHTPFMAWAGDDMTGVGASYGGFESWADLEEILLDRARKRLEEKAALLQTAHPGVRVETRIETGDPEKVLLDAVEEMHAERIVLGTHGRRGLARLLLGSIAHRVVREAEVPVTIVKAKTAAA